MATAGPNFVGTGANDSSNGGDPWSNPGNITADDTSYASYNYVLFANYLTQFLVGTNPGFSIPGGGTINGILVEMMLDEEQTDGADINFNSVRLVKAGTQVGTNKSTGAFISGDFVTYSFGGAADLWGTTWTPAEINNSGFGVALAVEFAGLGANVHADWFKITVTYTAAGSTGHQKNILTLSAG